MLTSSSRELDTMTQLHGTVIRGAGRGRALGFPTANLALEPHDSRPANGIYAAWAHLDNDDAVYRSAVHVGPLPTFNDATPTVEVHLLDFPDQDLYGRKLSLTALHRLRDIKKFNTREALIAAITHDCAAAREYLDYPATAS